MNEFINEQEIRKAMEILKPSGQLYEVRIIGGSGTYSGYFTNTDTMLDALKRVNLREVNVYLTLGYVNKGCGSRVQHDTFRQITAKSKIPTTSDGDIDGYQWLFIDFDPDRPSGVSSSREELQYAADTAGNVYRYLQGLGFEEPVKAMSGNGYHLLYRVNLKNTPENVELVSSCMDTLKTLFSNDHVKIDTTTTNPSRICKLYGTLAQKGANTQDRPHRMSRIFSTAEPRITDKMFLQKLVAQVEHEQKPAYHDSRGERFEITRWMTDHGIGFRDTGTGRDHSTVFALDECPFNSQHKNGDAKIFSYPDGKISFLCHHNSCRGKRWQDVRLLYEPDAYSADRTEFDRRIEEGWAQHNRLKVNKAVEQPPISPVQRKPSEMFRTAQEIMADDEPDHEFVRSGITAIDEKMHGLEKQCISVISGLRGCGKSTLIGTMILTAVQDGHTVVVYSGELNNRKYLHWLHRQAAGKAHVEVSTRYMNGMGVPKVTQEMINAWMGGHFRLYDNRCGNSFPEFAAALEAYLTEVKADIAIVDNMMALDLDARKDKYDAQTEFVWTLKNIAQRTNTHIVFVAHPKKAMGLIRLDDISGAGNIGNIVDNAFMVHRNNEDFKKRIAEFSKDIERNLDQYATNFIEIAKDREGGIQDLFVPLYYEESTKRLRNSRDENVVYGWQPEQVTEWIKDVTQDVADEIPW